MRRILFPPEPLLQLPMQCLPHSHSPNPPRLPHRPRRRPPLQPPQWHPEIPIRATVSRMWTCRASRVSTGAPCMAWECMCRAHFVPKSAFNACHCEAHVKDGVREEWRLNWNGHERHWDEFWGGSIIWNLNKIGAFDKKKMYYTLQQGRQMKLIIKASKKELKHWGQTKKSVKTNGGGRGIKLRGRKFLWTCDRMNNRRWINFFQKDRG